jgi:hypothetical protein
MSEGEVIAALMTAIAALFSALIVAYRQALTDWKTLYEHERKKREEVELLALQGIKDANTALEQILKALQSLPRRKSDWEVPQ